MKVTIIVPVYKVEQYLNRCVDSILAQTFRDFELILVDDGSPDGCPAICDAYAKSDTCVKVIHQQNGGLSAARNAGIDWAFANSDSEWLMFVDSDDWIAPQTLKLLYDANIRFHTDVSSCNFEKTDAKSDTWPDPETVSFQRVDAEKYYYEENVSATVAWGKLYRKSCFQNIRYPVGKIHEDEYVTYKILFNCSRISVTNSALYFYYQRADSIVQAAWTPKRMAFFEAVMDQIQFFQSKGMDKIAERRVRTYISIAVNQIQNIEKSIIFDDQEKKNNIHLLKKAIRRALRKFGREYFPLKNNYYPYELAFPKGMQLYWYEQAILRKLHIKKDS